MSDAVERATPSTVAPPDGRDWRLSLALGAGLRALRTIGATWRVRHVNDGPWRALRAEGRPFVWTLWHGRMLPALWGHRGERIKVLISSHRDGEIITGVIGSFGLGAIRGSSSRGAARALLAIVRELEAGSEVALTPDGPRGPAETFAPGAVLGAQRAGVPIVAIGAAASRAWRLGSWDRFTIPKPFATIALVYSDPVMVEAATMREAEREVERFQALMRDLDAAARDAVGAVDR